MNHLQHESSPYLLQHAHNPVDWYAWKPEAFERAIAEQKPILVSIGYSTCHWCHVMERESFENEEVAAFMNEHFINIKVDREERPDVDAIYMEACQLLTGGGGWPLNCFLTPDAKPFYAGTYFPPRPAHNRPGWIQLLQHLANIWETKRDTATEQAERLLANIQRNDGIFIGKQPLNPQPLNPSTAPPLNLEAMFTRIRANFDHAEGGFGGAPKFPSTMALQWLLNWHYFSGNPEALQHALFSLDKMARGGIYDQIGGGFARYATDREWLIPHFEKMLYDNALLVSVLSEAYKIGQQSTVNGQHSTIIQQTLSYIAREMTSPEGGFYSAQDADSEGVEGKFFVWDKSEIKAILGKDAELFCNFYGVTDAGNWEEKNILWRPYTYEAFAADHNVMVSALQKSLSDSAEKLLAVRSRRIWPGLDNKILLGWNALMASAYVAAFTALGHEEYRQAAIHNVEFLLKNFQNSQQSKVNGQKSTVNSHPPSLKLRRVKQSTVNSQGHFRHSASQLFAFLEDYAYLIAALVDVHQVTFEPRYLQLAGDCTDYVFAHFYDPETGMFFFTDKNQTDILFRKKDLYDNATPSGNSTMVHNLQRLGILLDRSEWRETASSMLAAMRETVEKYPLSFQRWATAMMNEVQTIQEIAIVGENAFDKALEIQRGFLPNKVIAASQEPDETQALLAGKPGAADALIYVCRNFACQKPVSGLTEFWDLVNS